MRGNRRPPVHRATPTRSIPACAGEPRAFPGGLRRQTVYPRVCGGTHRVGGIDVSHHGLSPRVRGNPALPPVGAGRRRSIPACAGEPIPRDWQRGSAAVYPRVCGGTYADRYTDGDFAGLSPRVRGNPSRLAQPTASAGSIPACAGEPCRLTDCRARTGGLSPRVRGNPHLYLLRVPG